LTPEAVKDFVGYYSAKRELARRLGVDHNSPNEVLQVDFEDLACSSVRCSMRRRPKASPSSSNS
jgi:hypothetical protein